MVGSVTGAAKPADKYHHGDLRQALIDIAPELVRTRGVPGFTLKEAAQSVGVSSAAAYRHFADREDLLVAVAVDGYRRLMERLQTVTITEPFERLTQLMVTYLRWTTHDHPAFEVMFTAGLNKALHPTLTDAGQEASSVLTEAAISVVPDDPPRAQALLFNTFALVQGYALMLGDPNTTALGPGPDQLIALAESTIKTICTSAAGP
ncbi:TetR/AcrR family transcriptional regulator [soil metagenome]